MMKNSSDGYIKQTYGYEGFSDDNLICYINNSPEYACVKYEYVTVPLDVFEKNTTLDEYYVFLSDALSGLIDYCKEHGTYTP